MLPLTLPSPPLGERDSSTLMRSFLSSLSPIGGEGRVRGRFLAALFLATTMLWAAPAPADDPEVPEKYISVDEAKALVDKRQAVVFIDVREKPQYDDLHIKGALNIPLDSLRGRLRDVPRKGLLVLY
jgi:hypothetical protein